MNIPRQGDRPVSSVPSSIRVLHAPTLISAAVALAVATELSCSHDPLPPGSSAKPTVEWVEIRADGRHPISNGWTVTASSGRAGDAGHQSERYVANSLVRAFRAAADSQLNKFTPRKELLEDLGIVENRRPRAPKGLPCKCGCGGIVTPSPVHRRSLFIEGHSPRERWLRAAKAAPPRPCKCGCGGTVDAAKKSQLYVPGHSPSDRARDRSPGRLCRCGCKGYVREPGALASGNRSYILGHRPGGALPPSVLRALASGVTAEQLGISPAAHTTAGLVPEALPSLERDGAGPAMVAYGPTSGPSESKPEPLAIEGDR